MRRLYVHLPRFPVQRRVLQTPSLQGKPLALVENLGGHLRVAFASTTALRAGIRPGMSRTAACALVPDLPCLNFDPEKERQALASLAEALLRCGPSFQLAAPDGLWLDAVAAHLFGGEEGLCQVVLEVCASVGYQGKVAVSSDAFGSRALARFGKDRQRCVPEDQLPRALAPLPLGALEGNAQPLQEPLRSLGLTTLAQVAALPPGAVAARLGAQGLWAQRLCSGQDDTPFVPEPLAEVLAERLELDWPAETMEPLLFALKTLVDRLCARLCGRSQAAVRLGLGLRLEAGEGKQVPLILARPSSQARLLLDLLRHRLSELTLDGAVVGLELVVEEACEDRKQQLALGDAPVGDAALEVVLSRLATALGEQALFSAALVEEHRPEGACVPAAFRPPPREQGLVQQATAGQVRAGGLPCVPPELEDLLTSRPSRLLKQPAALEADVGQGGQLCAARLLGRRRRVEALCGPERLCGGWWEGGFARDYYKVHFEGLGPAWIFRDEKNGRFYLHGLFD
jgi:protein ImuB